MCVQDDWHVSLCVVHLVESFHCTDASRFISVVLTSLATMLQLEMPHINVLSKVDLIEKFGELQFGLEVYTEVLDLSYILQSAERSETPDRFHRLTAALAGLVEDFGLVQFTPMTVNDSETLQTVLAHADRACGYIYQGVERGDVRLHTVDASGATPAHLSSAMRAEEKYVRSRGSTWTDEGEVRAQPR